MYIAGIFYEGWTGRNRNPGLILVFSTNLLARERFSNYAHAMNEFNHLHWNTNCEHRSSRLRMVDLSQQTCSGKKWKNYKIPHLHVQAACRSIIIDPC